MKSAMMFVVPFVLALSVFTARADDTEWTGTVGCQKCAYSKETGATECGAAAKVGDNVYVLKGEKVSADFKKGGEWVIKGKMSEDKKSIEVTEMSMKK